VIKKYYYLLQIFIFSVLMVLTVKIDAKCLPVNGWQNRYLSFAFPHRLAVPSDLPVGRVFYETEISENHHDEKYASCIGVNPRGVRYINGWMTNSDGVAATNIPGVGIRIHWLYPAGRRIRVPTDPYEMLNHPAGLYWVDGPRWKVELIKIGDIPGGSLATGNYAGYNINNIFYNILNVTDGGNIVSTGCSLLSPEVMVPLGRHLKSEFTHRGAVTQWQNFDINLNCNRGTKIHIQIDAIADGSGVPGVMTLDHQQGDMVARGVGIQIGYRTDTGGAVVFGQEKEYWTSLYGKNELVKLQARYYQTDQQVTAGTANGTATFTLTYH
jgi:type 1 fimbria pilin